MARSAGLLLVGLDRHRRVANPWHGPPMITRCEPAGEIGLIVEIVAPEAHKRSRPNVEKKY